MTAIAQALSGRVPYPLLMQGDEPKGLLLERFREAERRPRGHGLLLQGVDVQGEALSLVVLIFPLPSRAIPRRPASSSTSEGPGKAPFSAPTSSPPPRSCSRGRTPYTLDSGQGASWPASTFACGERATDAPSWPPCRPSGYGPDRGRGIVLRRDSNPSEIWKPGRPAGSAGISPPSEPRAGRPRHGARKEPPIGLGRGLQQPATSVAATSCPCRSGL